MLIRPDGCVAWADDNADGLVAAIGQWFGTASNADADSNGHDEAVYAQA